MAWGMRSHTDIIDRWPSLATYASDIDVAYVTAQVMRYRGSIHPRHWDAVVDAARIRGWEDITHELLSRTRPKGRPKNPKARAEARAA